MQVIRIVSTYVCCTGYRATVRIGLSIGYSIITAIGHSSMYVNSYIAYDYIGYYIHDNDETLTYVRFFRDASTLIGYQRNPPRKFLKHASK